MSENVGASTCRNPKGLHGLYRVNFTLPFTLLTYFRHNETQDCYSHFNLYSRHVSAVYGHHQVSSLCQTVYCTACLNFKIKIAIKIDRRVKFSKNGFDVLVGSISAIFVGVGVCHVVR
jgi:hypothetical protein